MTVEEYLQILKRRFEMINPNDFHLSYSGGKDSHLLYWFIKEYAKIDGIEIVGVDTFMEHDEILRRIYKNSDVVLKPKLTPFEIKEKYGIPCFTKFQDETIRRYQNGSRSKSVMEAIDGVNTIKFRLNKQARALLLSGKLHKISCKCDEYNKKQPIAEYEKRTGKRAIIGVRGAEGAKRKATYQSCFTKRGDFTPIYDLTDDMQAAIYKHFNIEIPTLYKYLKRSGCMGCPYGNHAGNTLLELSLLDINKRERIIDLFRDSYNILGIDYSNIQTPEYYLSIKKVKKDYATCLTCGKVFKVLRDRKGLYCSRACQHKSMKGCQPNQYYCGTPPLSN